MQTYSYSRTDTFTLTHARHIASKVAADMHLMSIYYGFPSETMIPKYADELAILLRDGYVAAYEFGFKRDGKRVLSFRYTSNGAGSLSADDDAGRIPSYEDTTGAQYFNFLTYSDKWSNLSAAERGSFEASLPIRRTDGQPPADGLGIWVSDSTYSAGGVSVQRRIFKPYG